MLDQNIPYSLKYFLQRQRPQWRAVHVKDVKLWHASDDRIVAWCREHQALLFTFDQDFANPKRFADGTHAGMIIVQGPATPEAARAALLLALDYDHTQFAGVRHRIKDGLFERIRVLG